MRILLTGFVPFGKVATIPSQQIIEQIAASGRYPQVVTAVLPVDYTGGTDCLQALITQHQPQVIICLGVAQNRAKISLERFALNVDDASLPDNAGVLRQGEPICAGEPLAYQSTLPLPAFYTALAARSIPVEFSNHAGAYLCNHVFYMARHLTDRQAIPCGFIHVPGILDETAAESKGLPLATMVEAIEICLGVLQNETC